MVVMPDEPTVTVLGVTPIAFVNMYVAFPCGNMVLGSAWGRTFVDGVVSK